MKKFLLCVVALFLFGSSMAQKDVTGFWGVAFGSSVDDVMTAMEDQGKLLINEANDPNTGLVYTNCRLGSDHNCMIIFQFVDNKMYQGMATPSNNKELVLSDYANISSALTEKHGAPAGVIKEYQPPYSDGDGLEMEALKEGKVFMLSHWNAGEAEIILYISKKLEIVMAHRNVKLNKILSEREAKASSSDY